MDHLASERMKIQGGKSPTTDSNDKKIQDQASQLEDMTNQLNQGSILMEARPGKTADEGHAKRRPTFTGSTALLNVIPLPIVSTDESEKLRIQLIEKPPGALHQRAWRNISSPDTEWLKHALGNWFFSVFPILSWLPKLNKSKLMTDVIAGVTVAVMLIPQSMSYADIAGLQYRYGLYAGFMPTLVYAFMGTSRQLAVGPVAMVSLLTNAGLEGQLTADQCPALYCPDPQDPATCYPSAFPEVRSPGQEPTAIPYECGAQYASLAFTLSLLVGMMQLGAGIFRAGYLVAFLGHPVVSGFTSGAAVIIGLSQVKYIMGYDIPKSQFIYVTLDKLFSNIGQTKYMPFILGTIWLFTLIGFKKGLKYYPKNKFFKVMKPLGPLTMCTAGIALMYIVPALKTDEYHVAVVGKVPGGLDGIWSASWEAKSMTKLIGAAVSIAIIGFMESISIAKALATQHAYTLVPGQELVALGTANIVGSCFSAYPTTGSFSRSAVNNSVGAQTPLSGMVTAGVMLLTLVALTPALVNLPKFCLGAIVISSVMNLFAYQEAIHLWTVKKSDFASWAVAFLGTIFLGVQMGLILAVALSLMIVIYESVSPQMQILWSIPQTKYYRHVKQPEPGNFVHGVMVVRIGASMYFANCSNIQSKLESMVKQMEMNKAVGKVEYIVLDMTPVVTVDASAIHALEDMNASWKSKDVQICFANVGTRANRTMDFAHFHEHHGPEWFLPEVHLAVKFCIKDQMSKNSVLRQFSQDGMVTTRMSSDILTNKGLGMKPVPEHDLEAQLAKK